MKNEILGTLAKIINALNNVSVQPGKENYLNQGGAIAMLENVYVQISESLVDRPTAEEENNSKEAG